MVTTNVGLSTYFSALATTRMYRQHSSECMRTLGKYSDVLTADEERKEIDSPLTKFAYTVLTWSPNPKIE